MISTDPSRGPGVPPSGSQVCARFAKTGRWYIHHCVVGPQAPYQQEKTAARTAAEMAYLRRTLCKAAPGRRVLDINCGLGDRAMGLAESAFHVTAMDVCETSIELARKRAADRRLAVEWLAMDPTDGEHWPVSRLDAVLCMHSFGWGPEALQLRLLRRIRRHLAEDGILVLEHVPFWWDGRYFPAVQGEPEFDRSPETEYDPVTGRVRAQIPIFENGQERLFPYEFRRYSLAELVALVREAGFAVKEIDSDLSSERLVTTASVKTEIVARSLPAPPASLAVDDWGKQLPAELDLRYASDEAELLDPAPAELWQQMMESAAYSGLELAGHYAVDDPYGGKRGAAVVAEHFGCSLDSQQVTFAAGVSAFLHFLGGLADGGPIAASEIVHGDLEAWAVNHGMALQLIPRDDAETLRSVLQVPRFSLLHLDRPTFTGGFPALDELEELIRLASASGVNVVIDEAAAPYPGPAQSAVQLVNRVNNLVVLRGFTKAYSWGGLRVGLAVASPALAARVRELVPPLQTGELALEAALSVLRAGDVFARLRTRIYLVKPAVADLLARCGFKLVSGDARFPWISVENQDGAAERLFDQCGIRCLRPASPPTVAHAAKVVRITIPLSEARIALFKRLLARLSVEGPSLQIASGPVRQ